MLTQPNLTFQAFGTLFSELDGKEYIIVHPKAYTELGRLLAGVANTPFAVPETVGVDEYGNYQNFYQAVDLILPGRYHDWLATYNATNQLDVSLTSTVKDRLCFWMDCKLNQSWLIDNLLAESSSKKRIVFVKEEVVVETEGNVSVKRYTHLPSHDFLGSHLQRRRYKLREKLQRRNGANIKKNVR